MITDLFTFDADIQYTFVLLGGELSMTGYVREVYVNGVVLDNLAHIPQTSILYFVPKVQKNETPPNFMV